jgi:spermidine/putrescine transport system ATP-binding protein
MIGKDIRAKSLSVTHRDVVAVHPTDLAVAAGEIVSLLGPSGCGKTSLLAALAGFAPPGIGRVTIGGADVTDLPPERRPTILLDRRPALFPRSTLVDDVAFGLEARGVPTAARRARADALLALVGLAGRGGDRSDDLGADDAHRVALARALAVDPAVLLLDQPFAALALDHRRRLRAEVKALQRRLGATIVLATDDREEAFALSDRVAVMAAGHIVQVDTPDRLYSEPATPFVARLLGEMNTLAGRIAAVDGDRVVIETPLGRLRATARARLAPGEPVEVMIRPERLLLEPETGDRAPSAADPDAWNRIRADLVGRTLEGATVTYAFTAGDTPLVLRQINLGLRNLLLASLHAIVFHADDVLVFPAAGRDPDDG